MFILGTKASTMRITKVGKNLLIHTMQADNEYIYISHGYTFERQGSHDKVV